jgi:hypothetical protein
MSKVLQELSFDENDNIREVYLVYRIQSDFLDPIDVSNELGIKPDRAFFKGQKYISKSWNPDTRKVVKVQAKHDLGIWNYSTKNKINSKRVEDHILFLVNLLEPARPFIEKLLNQPDIYSISIFIKCSPLGENGGYQVKNSIIIRIAKLCHFFDFWFSS